MLAYNIWRSMKMLARRSVLNSKKPSGLKNIVSNTVRIARLKLLFITAKVSKTQSRQSQVFGSTMPKNPGDDRPFCIFLDNRRAQPKPWHSPGGWPQRFACRFRQEFLARRN